jgi:queuine/archaeosine tRNA-ribosyltransferase
MDFANQISPDYLISFAEDCPDSAGRARSLRSSQNSESMLDTCISLRPEISTYKLYANIQGGKSIEHRRENTAAVS